MNFTMKSHSCIKLEVTFNALLMYFNALCTFSFTKKGAFFIIKLSPSPAEAVDAQASNGLREALEGGGKCPFISMDSGIPGGFWNNPCGFRGMPLSRN